MIQKAVKFVQSVKYFSCFTYVLKREMNVDIYIYYYNTIVCVCVPREVVTMMIMIDVNT